MNRDRWPRISALAINELRVYRHDSAPLMVIVLMPIIFIAFIRPAFRMTLEREGYSGISGAEQAVPGMIVMFAMFLIGYVGLSFLREYRWRTWERLRASAAHPADLVLGKALPHLLIGLIQQVVLLVLGVAVFGMHVRGPWAVLAAVSLCFSSALVACGVALFALCRSHQQVVAFSNVGAVILAGLGGAIAPVSLLPRWMQLLSPLTPAYWALRALRAVILDGAGLGAVAPAILALVGFAAAATMVAVFTMRTDQVKSYVA